MQKNQQINILVIIEESAESIVHGLIMNTERVRGKQCRTERCSANS